MIGSICLGDPKFVLVTPSYDTLLSFFCCKPERVPVVDSFSIPLIIIPSKLVSVGLRLLSLGLNVDPLMILSYEGLSCDYPLV